MYRFGRLLHVVPIVALVFSGCAREPEPSWAPEIRDLLTSASIPGLQMVTVEDGAVAEEMVFGSVNADSGSPVTPTTVFEAASLSKPVTAYIAFRMVDRGELDLDLPLWNLLEYERLAHDERARAITPRLVLSHTTGLPNWGGTPLQLNADPGQAWGYSGEGFVYLQRVMEKVTGRSLEELARSEVFQPMGMEHSSFVWQDEYETLKASGHDVLGRPVEGLRHPDGANAAASLHTTARDYGAFLAAVLQGEGLSPESHAAMIQPVTQADAWGPEETYPYVFWGLGWGIQEGERGRAIWHWGDNGIYRAFVVGYPTLGDGLVYFTNSEAGLSVAEDLLSLVFRDEFWAARWLTYPDWDDPAFLADLALRRSFLRGFEEGMVVLDSLRADVDEEVGEELPGLMRFLAQEGESESALRLAQMATEEAPDDPEMMVLLAEIQTEGRLYAEAKETYLRAVESGADPGELGPRMAWLDEGLTSTGETQLTPDQLEALAGQYGPRRVRREGSVLFYSRDGGPETRLIPLSPVLFGLEASATFRLRFEPDPDGLVRKVHGLYSDGSTDESERTRAGHQASGSP
ncbi:MAG: serine hydrolase [Gemmatimonadota bacterium]|jgi:CubicO group peptidase (beta-lactamase class C family)